MCLHFYFLENCGKKVEFALMFLFFFFGSYVRICHDVIASTTISMEACAKWILPHLISLENDRVVNVRIGLARCISLLLDKGMN